jgi:hypothetical protein
MILQLLRAEKDIHYWHNRYFVRIFKEEYGTGWQVFRDDKFVYRAGQFVGLIDGGLCDTAKGAYFSAEEYIDNCLCKPEVME